MDEVLEAKEGYVRNRLRKLRKDQLITLAKAFMIEIDETMKKNHLIDEIIRNALKEAYEFCVSMKNYGEILPSLRHLKSQ